MVTQQNGIVWVMPPLSAGNLVHGETVAVSRFTDTTTQQSANPVVDFNLPQEKNPSG